MRKKNWLRKKGQKWRNKDIIKCCNPAHFIHGLRGISCRDMYCFQIIRAVRSTHFCNRTTHCVTCKLMFCHLIHVWRGMILYHTLLVNTEAPQMSALRIRIRVCLERNELFCVPHPFPVKNITYLFCSISFVLFRFSDLILIISGQSYMRYLSYSPSIITSFTAARWSSKIENPFYRKNKKDTTAWLNKVWTQIHQT